MEEGATSREEEATNCRMREQGGKGYSTRLGGLRRRLKASGGAGLRSELVGATVADADGGGEAGRRRRWERDDDRVRATEEDRRRAKTVEGIRGARSGCLQRDL